MYSTCIFHCNIYYLQILDVMCLYPLCIVNAMYLISFLTYFTWTIHVIKTTPKPVNNTSGIDYTNQFDFHKNNSIIIILSFLFRNDFSFFCVFRITNSHQSTLIHYKLFIEGDVKSTCI